MSTQFPNVPALPGVPNLARLQPPSVVAAGATTAGFSKALAAQLGLPLNAVFGTTALYAGLGLTPLPVQWPQTDSNNPFTPGALPSYGITASGTSTTGITNKTSIIQFSSCIEFNVNADSVINSHPIEQGEFEAYNRVQNPIGIRLLLACQGDSGARAQFLSKLKSLREGTQIVDISTPDTVWYNMTLKGFGYKKTSQDGMVTIWADTQWQEERSNNVNVSPPPTSQPQGAAVSNLGTIQAVTPTGQQSAAISNPSVPPSALPSTYANTAPPSGFCF